jgi:hypothetical protein
VYGKSKPRKLVHYSKSGLGVFTKNEVGIFKVRTQGRIYSIDIDGARANTSTLKPIKSALVFTDEALEQFEIHPWRTLFIWKRFFSQHRTLDISDMEWDSKDTVMHGSEVLQVKKIRKRSGNGLRIKWQRLKVIFVSACDWFVLLFFLSALVVPNLECENHWVVSYNDLLQKAHDSLLEYFVPICVLAVVLPVVGMFFSHLKNKKDSKFPFENEIRKI